MNHGFLVFLGMLATMTASWWGLVLKSHQTFGQSVPAPAGYKSGPVYPTLRPGQARQGAEIYVAQGCVYCHTQQIRQTGATYELVLKEAGTDLLVIQEELKLMLPDKGAAMVKGIIENAPQSVKGGLSRSEVERMAARLQKVGAKVDILIAIEGPDIERGWGTRRSVARDFLFDQPVQPGTLRIGPDLAGVGERLPDQAWHLLHLYNPRTVVPNSVMPPYPYLFSKQRIQGSPSPDALPLQGEFAPESGFEVIPKLEAIQLVAYLRSLRTDTPIFEAPYPLPPAPDTNSVMNAETNAPGAVAAKPDSAQ